MAERDCTQILSAYLQGWRAFPQGIFNGTGVRTSQAPPHASGGHVSFGGREIDGLGSMSAREHVFVPTRWPAFSCGVRLLGVSKYYEVFVF